MGREQDWAALLGSVWGQSPGMMASVMEENRAPCFLSMIGTKNEGLGESRWFLVRRGAFPLERKTLKI